MMKLLETLEETTTKMPCLTGEVTVRVKINVMSYLSDLYHDYYIY